MIPAPAFVALILTAGAGLPVQVSQARPLVIASKPFGESYLLAEMFAQLLEARGFSVQRRPGLGATVIAFQDQRH